MKTTLKLAFVLLLLPLKLLASDFPIVMNPSINATPPGASVAAGFVSLSNESDKTVIISGAFSPTIPRVEIHKTILDGDVAKMEKQSEVTIDPGETLVLEHGGYHFMLMDLESALKPGDVVDVVVTTSVGEMLIEMPVIKQGMKHGDGHGGHKMKKKADHGEHKMEKHNMKKDGDSYEGKTKKVN